MYNILDKIFSQVLILRFIHIPLTINAVHTQFNHRPLTLPSPAGRGKLWKDFSRVLPLPAGEGLG